MNSEFIVPQEQTARQAEFVLSILLKAFRLAPGGLASRGLGALVRQPILRFTRLFGEIEQAASRYGLATAARHGLQQFAQLVKVTGNEHIPAKGPLLIVSNHVGAFDILVILSQILRNDLKVIASDVALLRSFPILAQYLIFTNFEAGSGMQAARKALRHLKDGGALLLFASAGIDPDPALYPQQARQELHNWKPSLDLFLRQVPEAQVIVTMVSGIVAPRWAEYPLTRIGKRPIDKRRIAEILQIMEQILFPGRLLMQPSIRYHTPMTRDELEGDARLALIHKAEQILDQA